jgi:hypothetical protein
VVFANPVDVESVKARGKTGEKALLGRSRTANGRKSRIDLRELELVRGQLWRADESFIQIMDVGKMLVHYRRSSRPETRSAPVRINSKTEILGYLRRHQAVLLEEPALSK